jgi:hypothetical protein
MPVSAAFSPAQGSGGPDPDSTWCPPRSRLRQRRCIVPHAEETWTNIEQLQSFTPGRQPLRQPSSVHGARVWPAGVVVRPRRRRARRIHRCRSWRPVNKARPTGSRSQPLILSPAGVDTAQINARRFRSSKSIRPRTCQKWGRPGGASAVGAVKTAGEWRLHSVRRRMARGGDI